jgi:hypothetical protein
MCCRSSSRIIASLYRSCKIWGSHSSGYEEYQLVGLTPCSLLEVTWRFRGTYVPLKHRHYVPEAGTLFIGLPSSLHILLIVVTKWISTEHHWSEGNQHVAIIILFNFLLIIPTWQPHKSVKWEHECMIIPALNVGSERGNMLGIMTKKNISVSWTEIIAFLGIKVTKRTG